MTPASVLIILLNANLHPPDRLLHYLNETEEIIRLLE